MVEDPIGPSMFDPDGKGHRGKTAIAAFWDKLIAPNRVFFDVRESYACGSECANVGTVNTVMPNGAAMVVIPTVDGDLGTLGTAYPSAVNPVQLQLLDLDGDTDDPGEAYADWPSGFEPIKLPWPLDPEAKL